VQGEIVLPRFLRKLCLPTFAVLFTYALFFRNAKDLLTPSEQSD
jgi:hypothetical protein